MWKFVDGEHWLCTDPDGYFPENKMLAIQDWLEDDLQNYRGVELFRADWSRVLRGELAGTIGNSTDQTLIGDEVRFESLYERWDDFVMPLAEMFEILDRYEEFLKEKRDLRRAGLRGRTSPP